MAIRKSQNIFLPPNPIQAYPFSFASSFPLTRVQQASRSARTVRNWMPPFYRAIDWSDLHHSGYMQSQGPLWLVVMGRGVSWQKSAPSISIASV